MEKEVKIKNFPNLRTVYLTGEINADALQQFKKDLDLLIEADNEIFNDNVRSLADVNPELSKAYKEHVKFPPLILDITSPGGSVYAALALYDIIRNYNLKEQFKMYKEQMKKEDDYKRKLELANKVIDIKKRSVEND